MAKKLRALTDLSLRKSPDPESDLWDEWYDWKAGRVFTPPDHMNVERALARGIAEEVKGNEDNEGKGKDG